MFFEFISLLILVFYSFALVLFLTSHLFEGVSKKKRVYSALIASILGSLPYWVQIYIIEGEMIKSFSEIFEWLLFGLFIYTMLGFGFVVVLHLTFMWLIKKYSK